MQTPFPLPENSGGGRVSARRLNTSYAKTLHLHGLYILNSIFFPSDLYGKVAILNYLSIFCSKPTTYATLQHKGTTKLFFALPGMRENVTRRSINYRERKSRQFSTIFALRYTHSLFLVFRKPGLGSGHFLFICSSCCEKNEW